MFQSNSLDVEYFAIGHMEIPSLNWKSWGELGK